MLRGAPYGAPTLIGNDTEIVMSETTTAQPSAAAPHPLAAMEGRAGRGEPHRRGQKGEERRKDQKTGCGCGDVEQSPHRRLAETMSVTAAITVSTSSSDMAE